MKQSVFIICTVFLFMVSCNHKKQQYIHSPLNDSIKIEIDNRDSIARLDSIKAASAKARESYPLVLYDYYLGNGKHRIFYQVRKDNRSYYICTRISKKSAKELKPTIIPFEEYEKSFFYEDGSYYPYFYKVSPNGKYLYATEDLMTSGMESYDLYRINCRTLKVKHITDCVAVKATKKGFTVAQARVANYDTATCAADYIYAMHDEYYDWSGNFVSKSKKEYDWHEMSDKYKSPKDNRSYVRNFDDTIIFPTLK